MIGSIICLDGTIKLGICFEDFVRPGQTFTHPFGFDSEQCAINRDLMLSDSILTDFSNTQAVHFDIVKIIEVLDKRFETFDRLTVLEEFFNYKDQTDSIIVDTSGFTRAVVKDLPDFEFVDLQTKYKTIKH